MFIELTQRNDSKALVNTSLISMITSQIETKTKKIRGKDEDGFLKEELVSETVFEGTIIYFQNGENWLIVQETYDVVKDLISPEIYYS